MIWQIVNDPEAGEPKSHSCARQQRAEPEYLVIVLLEALHELEARIGRLYVHWKALVVTCTHKALPNLKFVEHTMDRIGYF
jgi:hypothetical protein